MESIPIQTLGSVQVAVEALFRTQLSISVLRFQGQRTFFIEQPPLDVKHVVIFVQNSRPSSIAISISIHIDTVLNRFEYEQANSRRRAAVHVQFVEQLKE